MAFILGRKDSQELTGEIRFPQYAVYPTKERFNELYYSGEFKLSAINYKLEQFEDALCGI